MCFYIYNFFFSPPSCRAVLVFIFCSSFPKYTFVVFAVCWFALLVSSTSFYFSSNQHTDITITRSHRHSFKKYNEEKCTLWKEVERAREHIIICNTCLYFIKTLSELNLSIHILYYKFDMIE